MFKRILSILLCLCLLGALPLTIFAEEAAEETAPEEEILYGGIIAINDLKEFLNFAENCRLDSFSLGLHVYLETDIDLTGTGFCGIPTFSGYFEGNSHTISGLDITCDGSNLGLFRYLTDTAVVRDLTVTGTVAPGGSAGYVGGIVGHNSGRVENCVFNGTVSGGDTVGGIAGFNALMGILDTCRTEGTVHGTHFVGGGAGENRGVLRSCENHAAVNTTVQQNSVELSDITMDTLTGSESSYTVTDIGGIAGGSSGVIRACVNYGDVGYPHMGYNIGGISGSQTGYIVDCANYGTISGRKEVGGIVGQMEPSTYLEFQVDTMQILQEQIDTMSSLTGRATANAQNSAAQISGQVAAMDGYATDAQEALKELLPSAENPVPDADSLKATQNAVSSSISGMASSIDSLYNATQTLTSNLSRDMQAISNQMEAIGATMSNAAENLGGSIYDVSDADTDEDITAKVALCANYGGILGDWNVGGVVGAISYENDLDPEDDMEFSGDSSMNYDCQVRAVILGCENQGTVEAKRVNAGGIVGWQYLGLVRACVNTGTLEAENADYVGGIAGKSGGYIRGCAAKCVIEGDTYVGGIAGEGTTISGCGAMVRQSGVERTGAVAGWVEDIAGSGEEQPILTNFYLVVDSDPGAIDGISYAGRAEPVSEDIFFAMEELMEVFHTVTVRFVHEDGTAEEVEIPYGDALTEGMIPAVPEKDGAAGYWEGLSEADTSRMTFNATFRAAYITENGTIQSQLTGADGLPVLLVQGTFPGEETVGLEALEEEAIESWRILLPGSGTATRLRYRTPEGWEAEDLRIEVRSADGTWREVTFAQDLSYLVFDVEEEDDAFRVTEVPKDNSTLIYAGAAAALAVVLAAVILIALKRRKKKA